MLGLQGPFGLPAVKTDRLKLTATASGAALSIVLSAPESINLNFKGLLSSGEVTAASFRGPSQIVLPSGATLGASNNGTGYINVYLVLVGRSTQIAVSAAKKDEGLLHTTTAVSGSSTSATALYSAGVYTSCPIIWVGRIYNTQATAGTYLTSPAQITVLPFDKGVNAYLGSSTTFTANGTYTVPEGVSLVYAVVVGGGGGGAASANSATLGGAGIAAGGGGAGACINKGIVPVTPGATYPVTIGAGGAGGTANNDNAAEGSGSSLDSLLTASGGKPGRRAYGNDATDGTISIPVFRQGLGGKGGGLGGDGGDGGFQLTSGTVAGTATIILNGTDGGNSQGSAGGAGATDTGTNTGGGGGGASFGGGAAGSNSTGSSASANTGGGGGGAGSTSAAGANGGAGGSGIVTVTVIG